MRGLCFDRYQWSLQDLIYARCRLDVERYIHGIRAGPRSLYENGLVHNDIHAGNIMIDDRGDPVIVDFDSYRKNGEDLGLKPGDDLSAETSTFANDFEALKTLESALNEAMSGLAWREQLFPCEKVGMTVHSWW